MASEPKTELTPEEKIITAYLYHLRKLAIQDIQIAMGGVNPARIHGAAETIGKAAGIDAAPRPRGRRKKKVDAGPELALVSKGAA